MTMIVPRCTLNVTPFGISSPTMGKPQCRQQRDQQNASKSNQPKCRLQSLASHSKGGKRHNCYHQSNLALIDTLYHRHSKANDKKSWWGRPDSNRHGLLQRILSPVRLPISPRPHGLLQACLVETISACRSMYMDHQVRALCGAMRDLGQVCLAGLVYQ
jgi:hypothetical protein